jgi:hypothetical protein
MHSRLQICVWKFCCREMYCSSEFFQGFGLCQFGAGCCGVRFAHSAYLEIAGASQAESRSHWDILHRNIVSLSPI